MAKDKLAVFISYSRRDVGAALTLVEALEADGFQVTIDRRDLPYGEEWQAELADFIRAADTVLWLVSPDSIGSRWVNWELGEVSRLSKRLIPLTIRAIATEDLPESLGKINLLPSEGVYEPGSHFPALVAALNSDRAWVKDGTRLLDRSREWKARNRNTALLLRGPALKAAELWSTRQPRGAPPPASDVLELILESRKASARRQRWTVAGALAAAVLGLGLAGYAFWEAVQANTNAIEAQHQTNVANDKTQEANINLDRAVKGEALAKSNADRAAAGEALAKRNADLAAAGEKRAVEGEQQARDAEAKAKAQRDAALRTQSRLLADRAKQADVGADYGTAALLAIESFPDKASGDDRPYVADAVEPLAQALRNLHEVRVLGGEARPMKDPGFAMVGRFLEKIQFDAKGATIIAGRKDETVRIWHADDSYAPTIISNGGEPLYDYSMSPDGQEVVTSSNNGLLAWDAKTGKQLRTVFGPLAPSCVAYAPNGRTVAIAVGNALKLIEMSTGRVLRNIESQNRRACSAAVSVKLLRFDSSGENLVSMSGKAGLIYNLTAGTLKVLPEQRADIQAVAISGDGQKVATASEDGETRIWEAATGKQIALLKATDGSIGDVTFDPAGTRVLTGAHDGTARLWDWKTATQPLELKGHTKAVSEVHFSPDGKTILTTSFDATAKLWNAQSGALLVTLAGHSDGILSGAFSPDGSSVATGGTDGSARLWMLPDRGPRAIARHGAVVNSVRFSGDDQTLVTASADRSAKLWKVSDGSLIRSLDGHGDEVMGAALCRDGRLAATASTDKTVRIWRLDSQAPPLIVSDIHGIVFDVAFNSDCQLVAASSMDDEVKDHFTQTIGVWDTTTGKRIAEIRENDQLPAHFAFSPKGGVLAVAFQTTAELRDIATGAVLKTLNRNNDAIGTIAFDHSGDRLFIGSGRDVVAWSVTDGSVDELLHKAVVRAISVDTMVAAGRDYADESDYKLWDMRNDREVEVLEGTAQSTGKVGFSHDGKWVAVPMKNGSVQIWPARASGMDLSGDAKSMVTRCLTPEQRTQAFLDPEPPAWCITGPDRAPTDDPESWRPKWPYDTADWKEWLIDSRAGKSPKLPGDKSSTAATSAAN